MEYILETQGVTKKYGSFVLDSIDLKVPYGKIVGLIGENGAGKTTFIRTVLNQIKKDAGIIRIFGLDNVENDITCKKSIGFVTDECCFHNCLNANNINSIMKHIYINWDTNIFIGFMDNFHINPMKKINDLSKGMKSKLLLAIALSHSPKLLILDEITSGLDPIVRDDILLVLKDYVTDKNASVIFSTHVTSDLDRIADEIAFLHEGKLIFHETTKTLNKRYKLIRCSMEEYNKLPKDYIEKTLVRGDEYIALTRNNGVELNEGSVCTPSVDEIMLLYIKGENTP